MKRRVGTFAIACLAALATGSIEAAYCGPCAEWLTCGDFEVGAEGLYMVPLHSAFDYAAINDSGHVRVGTVECDTDWGFRVFGGYRSDCSFVRASYTWYQATDVDQLDQPRIGNEPGPEVIARDSNVGFARVKGNVNLHYRTADFRYGGYLHRARGCSLYFYANGRWVDVSLRRRIRGVESSGTVDLRTEKSEFIGGAIGIGSGVEFKMWGDFGLFGEGGFSGVIADRKTPHTQFIDGDQRQETLVTYRSKLCMTPEALLRLGLNYSLTCGCWDILLEAGYEVDYYWKALSFAQEVSGVGLSSDFGWERRCEDVGFAGLFFGARLRY